MSDSFEQLRAIAENPPKLGELQILSRMISKSGKTTRADWLADRLRDGDITPDQALEALLKFFGNHGR